MTEPHTMSRSEVAPCPFCGSDAAHVFLPTCDRTTPYNAGNRAFPEVRCPGCYATVGGKDWDATGESAITAWNTRAPSALPVGWKLVPVEPTREMQKAAFDALELNYPFGGYNNGTEARDAVYRAMLSASPPPDHVPDVGNMISPPSSLQKMQIAPQSEPGVK